MINFNLILGQIFLHGLLNFRQCFSVLSPIGESLVYFRQCISVLSPIGESLVYFRQYIFGLSPIIGESLIGEERIPQKNRNSCFRIHNRYVKYQIYGCIQHLSNMNSRLCDDLNNFAYCLDDRPGATLLIGN